jgi:hypothetical protein
MEELHWRCNECSFEVRLPVFQDGRQLTIATHYLAAVQGHIDMWHAQRLQPRMGLVYNPNNPYIALPDLDTIDDILAPLPPSPLS